MEHTEDINKHIGYIQQCLSNDKKPLAIFIGAGCPTSIRVGDDGKNPLIPDIAGVSDAVRKSINANESLSPSFKIIEEQLKTDGREGANVEYLLSHIRRLRSVAGNDEVRGVTGDQLDKLDEGICKVINELANKQLPSSETTYHKLALWIDGIARDRPVEIFTTNYDLLMEQALEETRVSFFDGFAGARRPFFDIRAIEEDKLPPRWARVWKLHGSINWYHDDKRGVIRGGPSEAGLRRIIHPTHLKYDESRRMPYLAMQDRLHAFLMQPMATLIICGYSFNDEHINECILEGLQGNQTASAFGLLFGNLANYELAIKAANGRSNLSLLATDASVVGSRRGGWAEQSRAPLPEESDRWVKWEPKDEGTVDGTHIAKLQLGDFSIFGDLLQDILGGPRKSDEQVNAQ